MENKIRNTLNEIYFGKTRDIVNGLRSVQPLAEAKKTKGLQVNCLIYYTLEGSVIPQLDIGRKQFPVGGLIDDIRLYLLPFLLKK